MNAKQSKKQELQKFNIKSKKKICSKLIRLWKFFKIRVRHENSLKIEFKNKALKKFVKNYHEMKFRSKLSE